VNAELQTKIVKLVNEVRGLDVEDTLGKLPEESSRKQWRPIILELVALCRLLNTPKLDHAPQARMNTLHDYLNQTWGNVKYIKNNSIAQIVSEQANWLSNAESGINHAREAAAVILPYSFLINDETTAFLEEYRTVATRGVEVKSEYDNLIAQSKKDIHSAIKEFEDQTRSLRSYVDSTLKLQPAMTFWEKNSDNSKGNFRIVSMLIVLVVSASYWLVFTKHLFIQYDGSSISSGRPLWLSLTPESYISALSCAFVIIWTLRFLVKLLISFFSSWQDSRERAIMIQTYLQLIHDDKGLPKEARDTMIQAIFRPGSTAGKGDSMPISPFSVIVKGLQG
jgi:hypothetical protein